MTIENEADSAKKTRNIHIFTGEMRRGSQCLQRGRTGILHCPIGVPWLGPHASLATSCERASERQSVTFIPNGRCGVVQSTLRVDRSRAQKKSVDVRKDDAAGRERVSPTSGTSAPDGRRRETLRRALERQPEGRRQAARHAGGNLAEGRATVRCSGVNSGPSSRP
ncbi:unnamed protein product [Lampetra planeri]